MTSPLLKQPIRQFPHLTIQTLKQTRLHRFNLTPVIHNRKMSSMYKGESDTKSASADQHSWRKQLPYKNDDFEEPLYHSRCHCGRVKFSVNTAPLDAKLCHCRDCRVMHGAPIQHAAIFEKKSVHFEEGSLDHIRFYANERGSNKGQEGEEGHDKVPGLPRKVSCSHCGSRLADEGKNMFIAFPPTFVFPGGLPKTFLPTHHIFYSQRLFDMKDGLPKYARHKEEGAPQVDESEPADRSKGRGEQTDKHEDTNQELEMDQTEAEERTKKEKDWPNGDKEAKKQKTK